jgi:hypothetical protein
LSMTSNAFTIDIENIYGDTFTIMYNHTLI